MIQQVLRCKLTNGLLVAGGRAAETSPIFVFRMRFYVHRGSGQARVYPRRWLSLSSRAKAFTLKGRHRRFVGDSAFHTSLRGAPLLVGEQLKWYQKHEALLPVTINAPISDNYVPTSLINISKFLKATHRTKIRKIEIPRSMVVEALIDQEIVGATVSNDELESGVAPSDGVVATSLRSF